MALSENVKIGLQIEVAKSTSDVNALNKSLAFLEKSLDSVNKESKEYAAIEDTLAKKTELLNKATVSSAIANSNNAKSIGELNKAMKQLKAAQESVDKSSPDFKKLADAINKTEGRVGDLNDSFKTLTGTGVEKLNSSLGLLKESLFAGDTDKFKIGLQGVASAMSAIPIFAVIEGAKLLYENWDKVKSIFSSSANETARLTKNLEEQKRSADLLKTTIDSKVSVMEAELGLMEAQGASSGRLLAKQKEINEAKKKSLEIDIKTLEGGLVLEKQKLKSILDNDSLFESLLKIEVQTLKNLGFTETAAKEEAKYNLLKLNDAKESSDAIKKSENELAELKDKLQILDIKGKTDDVKITKKTSDEKIKNMQEFLANKAQLEEENANNSIAADLKNSEAETAIAIQQIEEEKQAKKDAAELFKELSDQQDKAEEKSAEETKKLDEQTSANNQQLLQSSFNAAEDLAGLLFSSNSKNLKAGSEEAKKAAKKDFAINKAFRLGQAVIDGASAVIKGFATSGPPGAIIAGVLSAINIAKIAATQYKESGGDSGGGASGAVSGSVSSTPTRQGPDPNAGPRAGGSSGPQLSRIGAGLPGVANGSQSGTGSSDPNGQPMRAYVVVGDVNKSQDLAEILRRRTHF